MADAASRPATLLSQFALALRDGITMQSGDARHLQDAATPNFRRVQSRQQPAHPFIGHSEEPVDGAMFARDRTTPFLLANGTFTGVNRSSILAVHGNYPP